MDSGGQSWVPRQMGSANRCPVAAETVMFWGAQRWTKTVSTSYHLSDCESMTTVTTTTTACYA
jgi:hypothetical protein